jgi:hypothetical protein
MAKKDPATKRLKASITRISKVAPYIPEGDGRAFTLGTNALVLADEDPVRKAFQAFQLDPRYKWHWHVLLTSLAGALFPSKRKPGAKAGPRPETAAGYVRLLELMAEHPNKPDTFVAGVAKKRDPQFAGYKTRRICDLMRGARDWRERCTNMTGN